MRLLSIVLLCSLAFSASADTPDPPLPALYAVTGVADDDVLNIRARPDAGADIIGALPPDASGVEVITLSRSGRWAQINVQETSGWVAVGFLRPAPAARSGLGLPQMLQCFGTEPFWSMTFLDTPALILRKPEGDTQHSINATAPSAAYVDLAQSGFRFMWQDGDSLVTAHILPGTCGDGMSDRAYGLHYLDDLGPRVGCCSLN